MNTVRLALAAAPFLFVVACVDSVAGEPRDPESRHLQGLRDTPEAPPPPPSNGGPKTGPTSPPARTSTPAPAISHPPGQDPDDSVDDDDAIASDDTGAGQLVQPEGFNVACTTHQGNTAGWADCSGTATARLTIDCTAPQFNDYHSPWITFSGSISFRGECEFGIHTVQVDFR